MKNMKLNLDIKKYAFGNKTSFNPRFINIIVNIKK